MLELQPIRNPIWRRADNHRDPAVLPVADGYMLFYTRYSNSAPGESGAWGGEENWSVASVFTPDFRTFHGDRDLSPKGFASPGDPTRWHGRLILPYQSYPVQPNRLCYSVSGDDGRSWSQPTFFLDEARQLPWNIDRRLIDPSFVVDGDTLHCYFVGSSGLSAGLRANYLGHAITRDPKLRHWQISSADAPLLGVSEHAPDGVENVMVFHAGGRWIMIFSEGLANQHLAYATSSDLVHWERVGQLGLSRQWWMKHRYGAPFVWREGDRWVMALMGEATPGNRSYLGLLHSSDGIHWTLCPESPQ